MAVLPQDQRSQILLVLTLAAAAIIYFAFDSPLGSVPGVRQMTARRDTLQQRIDSLELDVQAAQRAVRQGTVQQLQQRLAEYRATLDLMRQLVPARADLANLFDDITSRAKVRRTVVSVFQPSDVESGSPFDVLRIRCTVVGTYDQIGEFLSDIASLPRIIVPYDLTIQRVSSPTADTSVVGRLQASFQVRTFVKSADTAAAATRGGGE